MPGTLNTNGANVSRTAIEFEDFDVIRHSAATPAAPVTLTVTTGGPLDLSAELGTVSATITTSNVGTSLTTGGGNDLLTGGTGNDALTGGAGNDTLFGGFGTDTLDGGAGDDALYGDSSQSDAAGTDLLIGRSGNDSLHGGAGADRFVDSEGANLFYGNGGNDQFLEVGAGTGIDTLYGGAGADSYLLGGNLAAAWTVDVVADFGQSGVDVIGLGSMLGQLSGLAAGANPLTTGHARFLQEGGDTLFQIDRDGSGSAASFVSVLRLSGTTATTLTGANISTSAGSTFAPEAVDDSGFVSGEDGSVGIVTATLIANDYSLLPGKTLSFGGLTSTTSAQGATLSVNGGIVTYTPGAAFQRLKAGETATDTFTYRLVDNDGSVDIGTVSVNVVGVNDAPRAVADTVSYAPGPVSGNLWAQILGNDTDADVGDGRNIVSVATVGTRGQVLLNTATQSLTYTRDGAALDLLAPGSDSFTYTMADAVGVTSSAVVTVVYQPASIGIGVQSVAAPALISEFGTTTVSYTVSHYGLTGLGLTGTFRTELYLSRDGAINIGDKLVSSAETSVATLISQASSGAPLAFTVPASSLLTEDFGLYQFIVRGTLDLDRSVVDLKATAASNAVQIAPSYSATVQTVGGTTFVSGDPVSLTGRALATATGLPVGNAVVEVAVATGRTVQTFLATTDAGGTFTLTVPTFEDAAGRYQIKAYHPSFPGEDTGYDGAFDLLGVDIVQSQIGLAAIAGQAATGSFVVTNPGSAPISGLSLSVPDLPAGWAVTFGSLPGSLAAGAQATVTYVVTTPPGAVVSDTLDLRVTTSEGARDAVALAVSAAPAAADLEIGGADFSRTVLRGDQTIVEFTLTNTGTETARNVEVLLPNLPWMSLAGTAAIGDIGGGQSRTVSLLLTPEATQALGQYDGSFVVRFGGTGNTVRQETSAFAWKVTSDAKGSFELQIRDEFTLHAAEKPLVNDAVVRVVNATTGELVARYGDVDGTLVVTDLVEGLYNLSITTDKHATFNGTFRIEAGNETKLSAFLPRETVTYTFTVVEGTVEEATRVTVDATFDTSVPAPILTVSPDYFRLYDLAPGQSKTFDVTLSNLGFIAANAVDLFLPDPDGFIIEGLTEYVPSIAAKCSVVVPITITRKTAVENASGVDTTGSDGRGYSGQVFYRYVDGIGNDRVEVVRAAPIVYEGLAAVYIPPQVPVYSSTGGTLGNFVYGGGRGESIDSIGNGAGGGGAGPRGPGGFSFTPLPVQAITTYDEGVRVQVKLQIQQDVVATRTAFFGTLELTAGGGSIQDVRLDIKIYDDEGRIVDSSIFGAGATHLKGISALDGTADLAAAQKFLAEFMFLPSTRAAVQTAESYSIGGTLSYVEDGYGVTFDLNPVKIEVQPQPELTLDYFYQRNVIGDDPFTDVAGDGFSRIEASVPFLLGVQVRNDSFADAKGVRIESAKPKIVENEKGLLVDFRIIGSQVAGENSNTGLKADFGTVKAGDVETAAWFLESTLQGKFIDFKATFESLNPLGQSGLSLIKAVRVHELTQGGDFDGDGKIDFLVNDVVSTGDVYGTPDTLYLSDGSIEAVDVLGATVGSMTYAVASGRYTLSVGLSGKDASWQYLNALAPLAYDPRISTFGDYEVVSARRADGSVLEEDQAWVSDRTFLDDLGRPRYENKVHILDDQASSGYTLVLGLKAAAANVPPTLSVGTQSAPLVEAGISLAGFLFAGTQLASILLTKSDSNAGDVTSFDTSGWTDAGTGKFAISGIYGNAVLDTETGVLSYTLDNARAATQALSGGAQVTDDIDITVKDRSGASVTQKASFAITGSNDPQTVTRTLTSSSDIFAALTDDNYIVSGGAGNDRITTLEGNDTITGGTGNDTISSGGGNDTILFGTGSNGSDAIDGGVGSLDRIVANAAGVTIGLMSISGIEVIDAGGFANIRIVGTTSANSFDFSAATLIGIASIDAGAGNDTVLGSASNDVIIGGAGNDLLRGGGGNDIFRVGTSGGTDTHDGGEGADRIEASAANVALTVTGTNIVGVETISSAGYAGFKLVGTTAANTLDFSGLVLSGVALISGGSGNDVITGSSGADFIEGGVGKDTLTGGAGGDMFIFTSTTHSKGTTSIDRITDFVRGQDRIDLSVIDANTLATGNDAFDFIGTSVFSGGAGKLRFDATSIPGTTRIFVDVDGNLAADMEIHLAGTYALEASDFVL